MVGNGVGNGREPEPGTPAEGDLSRRLERLGANLDARHVDAAPPRITGGRSSGDPSGLGLAFRASSEFVAGVIVGGGLGWLFDRGLGTKPWGLIVFLMLGFAAGIYNVMRASGFLKSGSASSRSSSEDRGG